MIHDVQPSAAPQFCENPHFALAHITHASGARGNGRRPHLAGRLDHTRGRNSHVVARLENSNVGTDAPTRRFIIQRLCLGSKPAPALIYFQTLQRRASQVMGLRVDGFTRILKLPSDPTY